MPRRASCDRWARKLCQTKTLSGHNLAKLGKHFLDVRMPIVGANCAFRLDILNVQQAEDNARRTAEIANSQASVRFAKGLKQKDLIFLRPWDLL
jgi:hypothetical protein